MLAEIIKHFSLKDTDCVKKVFTIKEFQDRAQTIRRKCAQKCIDKSRSFLKLQRRKQKLHYHKLSLLHRHTLLLHYTMFHYCDILVIKCIKDMLIKLNK